MKYSRTDNTLLKDTYNALIFDIGRRREIYLVGGYIRDIFRGIASRDRDYIIRGNVLTFARNVQKRIGGSIVVFKPKNTIRLALEEGHIFDFTELNETLQENLSKRDFTMNALAWSPETGIVDFNSGIIDIQKRVVRCISKKNMVDDPLRMLRAFRFAAEMNGIIDAKTRRIIKRFHNTICTVSNERITLEMFHLLNADHPSKYLGMSLDDNILSDILSFNNNLLAVNIKVLDNFKTRALHLLPHGIKVTLHDTFSQNLSYSGLLCLHILLRDCSLTKSSVRLTMSRRIVDRIRTVADGSLYIRGKRRISKGKLFEAFRHAGDAALDILIVCDKLRFLSDLGRFRRIWGRGLLSSEEVMKISGIRPGLCLGEILMSMKKAQFKGKLKTRSEAISFIKHTRTIQQ